MSEEGKPERIFLIGPRGSGKTTVARLLAAALGWQDIDADAELEARADCCIREIFETEGEAGFRRREADVLADLCRRNRLVIATGGGVILREENCERLKTGRVIWLTADAEALWARINDDSSTRDRRPALTAAAGKSEVEHLLSTREPLYRACADLMIDTTAHAPEDIVHMILSSLTTNH
jgi:shikimate kinase